MRVADYLIDRLYKAGIEHAFLVCGGGSVFLCDAIVKSKMKFVACHHEQAAAFSAEGYARAREGLGLCITTSGPGATNAITGCAAAWMDHIPLVFISGQSFVNQTIIGHPGLRVMGVQEAPIIDLVKPITKYAEMVRDPYSIDAQLTWALETAQSGRPGPVWLDIPADIQNASCN